MTETAVQIDDFFTQFQSDDSLQTAYMEDPVAFLRQSGLPEEYIHELISNQQEMQALSEQSASPEPIRHMSGYTPVREPLMGPQKGTPKVTLQKTTNKWHWVTGYYLVLNNQATDDIVDGLLATAAVTGLVAGANPEVFSKTVAAAIAAVIVAEANAMKIMNRGKGVYYYLNPLLIGTPLQLASLVPLPN